MAQVTRVLQLNENQAYVLRVRALNRISTPSPWSESILVSTAQNVAGINVPDGLVVTPGIRSILMTWNANTESNFSHYEIYVNTVSFGGVDPGPQFKYGDFFGTIATINKYFNGATWVDLVPGTTYYIRMRGVNTAGVPSPFSSEVSATTGFVGNIDLIVNSLSGDRITVGTLSADRIATGILTAALILAGSIKTSDTGARVEIDSQGIRGYPVTGATPNFDYRTSDGSVYVRGVVDASTLIAGSIEADTTELATNPGVELAASPAEIMTNGTFDVDKTGWSGLNCALTQVLTPTQAGAGALQLTASAAGDMSAETPTGIDGFPVQPGSLYKISGYFRAQSTTRHCKFEAVFYNSIGNDYPLTTGWSPQTHRIYNTETNSSWVQMLDYFTAPPGTAFMSIRATVESAGMSEIHYIDTISLIQKTVSWGCDPNDVAQAGHSSVLTRDTSVFSTGVASIRAEPDDTTDEAPQAFSYSSVLGGFGYRMTVWVKGDPQPCILVAHWYDVSLRLLSSSVLKMADLVTATWSQMEWAGRAPPTAVWGMFGVRGTETNSTLYIDDISIIRDTAMEGGVVLADYIESKTDICDSSGIVMPTGTVIPWAGTFSSDVWPPDAATEQYGTRLTIPGVPIGWVPCDGRAISRTDYWRLFETLSINFGSGNGTTTFNVPDFRGRSAVCLDNMGGGAAGVLVPGTTLGFKGGEQFHTLKNDELPPHNHPGSSIGDEGLGIFAALFGGSYQPTFIGPGAGGWDRVFPTNLVATEGLGLGHNNTSPFLLVNFLIKA